MRFPVYRCEVCSKYHAAADGRLVQIHYLPADAPDAKGHAGFTETAEWFSGVRALCRWCVEAVRALPAAPAPSSHLTKGRPVTPTVWVFPVPLDEIDDCLFVRMPRGAVLLAAYRQLRAVGAPPAPTEHLVVAAVCDPAAPLVTRRFRAAGTGHPLDAAAGKYVGTALFMDDTYVLHVFDHGESDG